VGGRHAVSCQPARDLTQCPTVRALEPDAVDDMLRKQRRTSGRTWSGSWTRRFEVVAEEPLELGDGNQPLTPWRLYGVDRRHDSAVDREMLTPSASAACLRLYANGSTVLASRSRMAFREAILGGAIR
jgi:hypothetical protein